MRINVFIPHRWNNDDYSEIVENNNSSETIEEKTNNEKLDAIKAKLAALKANQK